MWDLWSTKCNLTGFTLLQLSVVSIIPPSLILRDGRMLTVFENRVLRRIFGLKRDEVTGEWRKLHNKELNSLYCSPNTVWVFYEIT